MSIELVAKDGHRIQVPRGWVILTLVLASWGVASIVGVLVWLVIGGPLLDVVGIAILTVSLLGMLWWGLGHRLFIVWLEKRIEDDNR